MRTSIVPRTRRDQRLDLHKLDFGEIDASIELTFGKQAYFRDAFYVPEELDIAEFQSGRGFFVYGLKGTGKTALLRYLSQQIENAERHTRFIVFRHDIAEHDRQRLERLGGVSVVDDQLESDRIGDFEDAWLYHFHRYPAIELKRNPRWNVLKHDTAFDQYYNLVTSVENPKPNRLASLLEFVKQGYVKSALDAKIISLEVSADLDFTKHDQRDRQRMSLSALVQTCNRLLSETGKGSQWLYVFVDEVNVSFGSRKQYKRDCLLIRDLICSIYRLNELMTKSDIRVRFVCALRSEILGVSWIAGKEVNKYITGCGVELGWHRRVSFENQPLLRIVEKKILASEKKIIGRVVSNDVWYSYFGVPPASRGATAIKEEILSLTWYTPRDIVLLFQCAIRRSQGFRFFNIDVFRRASGDYSAQIWREKEESLSAHYAMEEVAALKVIVPLFVGGIRLAQLRNEIERLAKQHSNVQRLAKDHQFDDVLDDLFRIGIIGNKYWTGNGKLIHRWAYRGSDDLDRNESMVIHRALMPKFAPGEPDRIENDRD
jgi:hypothetical protein